MKDESKTKNQLIVDIESLRTQLRNLETAQDTQALTKHTQVEDALWESEERFRRAFEQGVVGLALADKNDRFININEAFCKFTGYTYEEILRMTPDDFAANEEDRVLFREKRRQLFSGEIPAFQTERSGRTKSGDLLWVKMSASTIKDQDGNVLYVMNMLDNITDRKRAEEALRASEEKFRLFFKNASEYCYIVTPDGHILDVNNSALKILGYTKDELVGRPLISIYAPEVIPAVEQSQRTCQNGGELRDVDLTIISKGGKRHAVSLSAAAVTDEAGQIKYSLSVQRDITKRKHAQNELEKGMNFTDATINAIPGTFYVWTEEGELVRWNKTYETRYGYTGAELRAMSMEDWFDEDELEIVYDSVRQCFEEGESSCEASAIAKDGRRIPSYFTGRRLEIDGRRYMVGVGIDITKRKQAQAESDRLMEEVGNHREQLKVLTGQLVHAQEEERKLIARDLHDDIGQELTAASIELGRICKISQNSALKKEITLAMEMVDSTLEKIRNLSRDLRPSMLDDLGIIPALRWFVKRQTMHGELDVSLDASGMTRRPPAAVETGCYRIVQEAMTNIMKHASATRVEIILAEEDAVMQITIRDDGCGFDVDKALKNAARGQSLGLLSMRERVKLLDGRFEIVSTPSTGTEIIIYLPLSAG